MIDIHTHILPQMDDGSSSIDESLAMIQASVSQGVTAMALTPHFYPQDESPTAFLKRRKQAVNKLLPAVESRLKHIPTLYFGAEVEYFDGISRSEFIDQLCIGQTSILLIEMPFCTWTQRMIDELYALRDIHGITPLLAHVERYSKYQRWGTIQKLCDNGILIQANASFFLKKPRSWRAMRMLKKHQIHVLGSDCHNMRSRYPNLGQAFRMLKEKGCKRQIAYLRHMERLLLESSAFPDEA